MTWIATPKQLRPSSGAGDAFYSTRSPTTAMQVAVCEQRLLKKQNFAPALKLFPTRAAPMWRTAEIKQRSTRARNCIRTSWLLEESVRDKSITNYMQRRSYINDSREKCVIVPNREKKFLLITSLIWCRVDVPPRWLVVWYKSSINSTTHMHGSPYISLGWPFFIKVSRQGKVFHALHP